MAVCHGIREAYQHEDVNIGWFPFIAVRDTEIRSKPGGGLLLAELAAGKGVGVQSQRNAALRAHPTQRRAARGPDGRAYYWCYARQGSITGWIEADTIAFEANHHKPPLDGPAGEDFEVGRTQPTRGRGPGCGKKSLTRPQRTVDADTLHLRYSPRGTSKHYLHRGDIVTVLIVRAPHGFAFVEVARAAHDGTAKAGTRGWVLAAALRA